MGADKLLAANFKDRKAPTVGFEHQAKNPDKS